MFYFESVQDTDSVLDVSSVTGHRPTWVRMTEGGLKTSGFGGETECLRQIVGGEAFPGRTPDQMG